MCASIASRYLRFVMPDSTASSMSYLAVLHIPSCLSHCPVLSAVGINVLSEAEV